MMFVALKFDHHCSLTFKQKESQKNDKDLKMLEKEVSNASNLLKNKCAVYNGKSYIELRDRDSVAV